MEPFNDRFLNKMETLNEIFLLLISDCLPLLCGNISDPNIKYMIGWVIITIIGISTLISLFI